MIYFTTKNNLVKCLINMVYLSIIAVILSGIAFLFTLYMARENYLKNPRPIIKHIASNNTTEKIKKRCNIDKSNPLDLKYNKKKEYYGHIITVYNNGAKLGLIKAIDTDNNNSFKRFCIDVVSGEQHYPIHEPSPDAIIPLYPKQSIAIFFVVSIDKDKIEDDYKINITFDKDFIKKKKHIDNKSDYKIDPLLE